MASLTGAAHLPRKLLDGFLLREPEKLIRARSPSQQDGVARYYRAAQRRIRVARDLHESADAVIALTLYREAAVLLIASLRQSGATETPGPARSAEEAFRDLEGLKLSDASPAPETFPRAKAVLANPDPLALEDLSAEEVPVAIAAATETVDWLGSLVEPRTTDEIRATRRLRLAGLALLVAYIFFKLWGVVFAPKNLALNKPVFASSQRPGTPPASGFVNGEIESNYGVHTNSEANPWVEVDLGAPISIKEVRVHNRADGFQAEILPLVLQLSDDGIVFTDIERRDTPFTQSDPWVVKTPGRRGRYVRVLMPRTGYIALTEIEVY